MFSYVIDDDGLKCSKPFYQEEEDVNFMACSYVSEDEKVLHRWSNVNEVVATGEDMKPQNRNVWRHSWVLKNFNEELQLLSTFYFTGYSHLRSIVLGMKHEQSTKAVHLRIRDLTCQRKLKQWRRWRQGVKLNFYIYFTYDFSGYVQDTFGSKTLLRLNM